MDLKDELAKLIILTASRTLMGREVRENMFDQARERDEGRGDHPWREKGPLVVWWRCPRDAVLARADLSRAPAGRRPVP